jgi:hypothetical protein
LRWNGERAKKNQHGKEEAKGHTTIALCAILFSMSPTVFIAKGFRFYFFSLKRRACTCISKEQMGTKFWLEPEIELAMQHGLPPHRVSEIRRLVEEHEDEIRNAWQQHIGS